MQIRLMYLGMLREVTGVRTEEVHVPAGSTLSGLLDAVEHRFPALADYRPILAFSVNYEYAELKYPLKDGDEVALLPPVSGGLPETSASSGRRSMLVRDVIDNTQVTAAAKNPQDGAVSVFDGIVRNNTRGRKTLYLVYEAYEEMALKQMDELCERAMSTFGVREARIVHRLGRLEVGETSVLIVVASAHRAAAMDACRFLIDSLKKTVPIWKKEFFEDGVVWADGEPFPDEIQKGRRAGE